MIQNARKLTQDEIQDVLSGHPDINTFWHKITQRQLVYVLAHISGDSMALTWVCLHDLAFMIQTATVALREAKLDWQENLRYQVEDKHTNAVHESRYSFDYAALCLSAASNHLASAMWHFHEGVSVPLGRDYKAASSVRWEWKRRSDQPVSLSIIESLLDSDGWKVISEYRDRWVHRGMPVIRGEFRFARREIWRDESDPAPNTFLMKTKRADGKVTYDTLNLIPDYDMPELLDKATAALVHLNIASDTFLNIFDEALQQMGGWKLTDKGMSHTYGLDQDKENGT